MEYGPGDAVALLSPNHIDYATAVLGVVHMGGILTPINPLYTPEEIANQVTALSAFECVCVCVCVCFLDP